MHELDSQVLDGCKRGEAVAFRLLVETYQDRVYALCVALAGAEGPDLAQETFVRVHAAVPRFDERGLARLSTWILTIARRLCRDWAEKTRVRAVAAVPIASIASASNDPEQNLQIASLEERVRRGVAALPEDQRAVLVLRAWDGLDYEEIAAIEEIPIGTVRSRLARARQTLAETLSDLHEQGGQRATRV